MRALAMGQYGHNNQPSHHVLWLLGLLGYRSDQDKLIREVIDRAYGVDFYAGDEDNGEMGAWFVLAALGLFSVSPASYLWRNTSRRWRGGGGTPSPRAGSLRR